MGKEEEHPQAATLVSITSEPSSSRSSRNNGQGGLCWCCCCCGGGNKVYRHFGVKCVLVLLLSGAVFLSAMFWLPPFFRTRDPEDLDLDTRFRGHAIVASFNVEKPDFFLQDNILQLEDDIFGEIDVASIRVVVLYTEPIPGSNITKVVFAIDPDGKNSKISSTALILIREAFGTFVTRQIPLSLTTSLFGEPFSFEVLKFQGGITIIPPQSAYLLQKVQIRFNFTLNFSIEEIQNNFYDLTSQLKSGLHLTSYENLYIKLSNKRGSTVAPPTTVQSSVLLAVGTPSMPRVKQLAQTIKGSHSGNLGLNNTIFGKVKQVSLSSVYEHSLNSSDGSAPSASPSAAPQPHVYHPPHHHHHHHSHHHHFHNEHMPPTIAPAPAYHRGHASEAPSPAHHRSFHAPGRSYEAKPPSPGCHYGYKGRSGGNTRKQYHGPAIPPVPAPHHMAVPPSLHDGRPAPFVRHPVPASSPIPYVVYAHAQPPTKSKADGKTPQSLPLISPSSYSSSAGLFPSAEWALALFLALVLHL